MARDSLAALTAPGVAATMIENGIREAIEKSYLKFKRRDEEKPAS